MKEFVLTTQSESGDDYIYFIKHPQQPTNEELNLFLLQYGSDYDEDQSYEHVQSCVEIEDTLFQKIPSK